MTLDFQLKYISMFLETSKLLLFKHKQVDFCQMKTYLPSKLEFVSFVFSGQRFIALKDQRFLDVGEVDIQNTPQNTWLLGHETW